jgi:hypothetical protein
VLLYIKKEKQEIGGDARSGKTVLSDATKKGTGKYPATSVLVSVTWGGGRGGEERRGEERRALVGYHEGGGGYKRKYVPFFPAHVLMGTAFLVEDSRWFGLSSL